MEGIERLIAWAEGDMVAEWWRLTWQKWIRSCTGSIRNSGDSGISRWLPTYVEGADGGLRRESRREDMGAGMKVLQIEARHHRHIS